MGGTGDRSTHLISSLHDNFRHTASRLECCRSKRETLSVLNIDALPSEEMGVNRPAAGSDQY
jgi:hypothetical protein